MLQNIRKSRNLRTGLAAVIVFAALLAVTRFGFTGQSQALWQEHLEYGVAGSTRITLGDWVWEPYAEYVGWHQFRKKPVFDDYYRAAEITPLLADLQSGPTLVTPNGEGALELTPGAYPLVGIIQVNSGLSVLEGQNLDLALDPVLVDHLVTTATAVGPADASGDPIDLTVWPLVTLPNNQIAVQVSLTGPPTGDPTQVYLANLNVTGRQHRP
ncbi:MAG: hypothetical protein FWG25_08080 [Promicromonosporaceae bacterium]|nr:hypothetical protein [Promicromonosporaceae bacterium]